MNTIHPQDSTRRISLSLFGKKGVLMKNPYNPEENFSWICVGKGVIVYGDSYCDAWDKWEEATKVEEFWRLDGLF